MTKIYCYYHPAGSGGSSSSPSTGGYPINFGHFMIEVEKDGKRTGLDYYEKNGKSIVNRIIDRDYRRKCLYISFGIPAEAANKMLSKINSWAKKPPEYDFPSDSTCVSRSNELLNMAGLGIKAITPYGMWSDLLKKRLSTPGVWRDRTDQKLDFSRPNVPPPPRTNIVPGLRPYSNTPVLQPSQLTTFKPSILDYGGSPTSINYRVKQGDNLYKLAPQYGYSDRRQFVNDFLKLNPHVNNPHLIYANQRYVMPIKPMIAGATYSDIFTRNTYQVNTYGRHIQTGVVPR